jgi:tetratricopeptide (TPR) repeat protein
MRRLLLLAPLALFACAHGPPSPTRQLDEAVVHAADSSAPARTVALAAFRALLVENQPEKARRLSDEALRRDPAEAYALALQMALAQRDGHPEGALDAALRLVRGAPRHPLSAAAARTIQDLAGTAASLDERILVEAPQALESGLSGDASVLLRSTLAQLQLLRDAPALAETRRAGGIPTETALLGPLSALHLLGFDAPTVPEKSGEMPPTLDGPFGPVTPRVLPLLDGRVSLEAEGPAGDLYVAAFDLEVPASGIYVVRTSGPSTHRVVLDGTVLFDHRSFQRPLSLVGERGVQLEAGRHRLLLVLLKEERTGSVALAVPRADGKPSEIRFSPARGPAPRWKGATPGEAPGLYPDAASLRTALLPEAGPALSTWLAVHDALGRDLDGCKRLLVELGPLPPAAAWNVLSAEVAVHDRTVPSKVARGRATRDLEVAVERDPGNVGALLTRGFLAVDDQRVDQAVELARRARAAHSPVGFRVLGLEARIAWAQGVDAQADVLSRQSLEQVPGLCEALAGRYDVARRRDAMATADGLVDGLKTCPAEQLRRAEHWKMRGQLDKGLGEVRHLRQRDPASVSLGLEEAGLLVSLRRHKESAEVLRALTVLRPRDAGLWKKLGETLATGGQPAQALAARERSLSLDGSDLPLRRLVERARSGRELLAEFAIDGRAALKAFEKRGSSPEGSSVLVVDAAATQAYPDGSMVDRIHTVEKVLDQSGIGRVAEVQIPQGAQVLHLRTLKADGTVLEPESLDKDTVSMPGVAVGDAVETEYLLAHASRRAASPGWTAGAFYFQVAGVPDDWATYAVVAPRGSGMTVDSHNMEVPPVQSERDRDVVRVEVKRSPALVPDPNAPPSGTEQLPFVIVGAGDQGQAGLLTMTADAFLGRGQRTAEIDAFAQAAAAGKQGLDAVRAVHAAVMERIPGRDAGLAVGASSTLAQDRGSRLWLLKAALESLGIPTRLVAVRTFASDPSPYRFPNENLLPYMCLRAEIPHQDPVWLDTIIRFGPFGQLPEQAANGREAYLLPEPGRPLAMVKTPRQSTLGGREVTLDLKLAEDGALSGEVLEVYRGFEAAQLAETLEGVSPEQRDQALQQALARYFGGAELSKLRVETKRAVGAPLSLRYHFLAPRFARVDEGRLTLGPLTYPAQVSRRYVTVGTRRSPLFIDSTELNRSHVTLRLPAGWRVDDPLKDAKLPSPFGLFTRAESQDGNVFHVEESYRLDMARIPVAQYEEFGAYAGQVDLLQTRDLAVLHPVKNAPPRANR